MSSPLKRMACLPRCELLTKFMIPDVDAGCLTGLTWIRKGLLSSAHPTGLSEAHFLLSALPVLIVRPSDQAQCLHCLRTPFDAETPLSAIRVVFKLFGGALGISQKPTEITISERKI